MKENEFTKEEIEINYDLIKKIEKHAENYKSEPDKKNFLRNVCAYEQKYILMNSQRPYDVLRYLDELDLKSSRLILQELNYIEIQKLLNLFTHEDKQEFYKTFSDLSLINQFIMKDEHAKEHLKDLTIDRKVKIMDSSNSETVLATSIVYESIPPKAREKATNSLTNADAVSALNQSAAYKEDEIINEIKEEHKNEQINNKQVEELTKEEVKENLKEEFDKQVEEKHLEKLREQEMNDMKKAFFMERIEHYKEFIPELKDIDLNAENSFETLPPEVLAIIEKDYIESKMNVEEENKKIELKAQNKYEKTKNNVDFLKKSNMKDFILRMNTIAIFTNICMQNEENLNIFKEKCPELYEEFSQYFGKSDAFDSLDFEKQEEIINKIQNNEILSNELKIGLSQIETSLGSLVKTKVEEEKGNVYKEFIANNSKLLEELNIPQKNSYEELTDDEKLRVSNYFGKNIEITKRLNHLHDDLVKTYNLNAKCVKENVGFADLLIAIDDKEKFKKYLSNALLDDNIIIDRNGNLSINNPKKEQEMDYKKYSIVGNGERNVGIVNNPRLLKLFEIKKQDCENSEIQNIVMVQQKNQNLEKAL